LAIPAAPKCLPLGAILTFDRSSYQLAEPTPKLGIEDIFNVVCTLTHQFVKLRAQSVPVIWTVVQKSSYCSLNWCLMSERVRCVVARPNTEDISAIALAVMTKTTRLWSVKRTVSIMALQLLSQIPD